MRKDARGALSRPASTQEGRNIRAYVASITGQRNLRMLRRYTHLKAEDLARKLG